MPPPEKASPVLVMITRNKEKKNISQRLQKNNSQGIYEYQILYTNFIEYFRYSRVVLFFSIPLDTQHNCPHSDCLGPLALIVIGLAVKKIQFG